MKKITYQNILAMLSCLIFATTQAQGLLYEVPMSKQVQAASQIVEGKVIAKASFWDVKHQNIYTVNTIEIYKVFKGQRVSTINVVTQGGTVGLAQEVVKPSLQLDKESIGVFMLNEHSIRLDSERPFNTLFRAYSGPQGFYSYSLLNNEVRNPFYKAEGISNNFYNAIRTHTNSRVINISSFDIDDRIQAYNQTRGVISITSFSPTTATAGTKSVLTINGIGFGTVQQNVGFLNPDTGGSNVGVTLQTQILSWSDTQITVEVPSAAGNGPVFIVDNPPTAILAQSTTSLSVPYAQINAVSDFLVAGINVAYQTAHVDRNGNGGYIWNMFTDFDADTAANESFVRAMDTWRCTTNVNWTIGPPTAVDIVANDDINIIRFDNGSRPEDGGTNPDALESGVLGVCRSYFAGCLINGGTDLEWYIAELDIVFDDAQSWEFGPGAPSAGEFDFETVAVHELGHGHQLAHVIDNAKIMHYAIGPGAVNRTLHPDDIAGAGDVHSRSIVLHLVLILQLLKKMFLFFQTQPTIIYI